MVANPPPIIEIFTGALVPSVWENLDRPRSASHGDGQGGTEELQEAQLLPARSGDPHFLCKTNPEALIAENSQHVAASRNPKNLNNWFLDR